MLLNAMRPLTRPAWAQCARRTCNPQVAVAASHGETSYPHTSVTKGPSTARPNAGKRLATASSWRARLARVGPRHLTERRLGRLMVLDVIRFSRLPHAEACRYALSGILIPLKRRNVTK